MSGRDSAPRSTSNDPISIFANEEKKQMARKPAPEQPAESVVEETTATVEPVAEPVAVPSVASDDLAYLRSQRKALDEQIRTAKAAKKAPKKDPDSVPAWAMRYPLSRINARVKAGQEQTEAISDTLAIYENAVRQALKTSTASDASTAE
jgi:hypothetical protein